MVAGKHADHQVAGENIEQKKKFLPGIGKKGKEFALWLKKELFYFEFPGKYFNIILNE
jgi:hypothetical protein